MSIQFNALFTTAMLAVGLTATPASACYFQDVNEEICPNPVVIKVDYSEVLTCDGRATPELLAGKSVRSNRLTSKEFRDLTGDWNYSAVDIGIWPDDSTSMIYSYIHPLQMNGAKVGYVATDGYINTEMESRIRMKTRYTLDGKVAAITCDYY